MKNRMRGAGDYTMSISTVRAQLCRYMNSMVYIGSNQSYSFINSFTYPTMDAKIVAIFNSTNEIGSVSIN